jgi:hypothetical protein
MTYTLNSNRITLSNGYFIDFEYPIKKDLQVNEVIIFIVDSPPKVVYNQNVFDFSKTGDFLWRIGDVKLFYWGSIDCPYIGVVINNEGEVVLFNWCDTAVIVDPETEEVLRTYQTK